MRFNPFKRKDKKKANSTNHIPDEFRPDGAFHTPLYPPTDRSAYVLDRLPSAILIRIFSLVCPHARDESYETADGSISSSACMLCDLRDLSHCAQVNRRWHSVAVQVLYHSVRIDPVHYCKLEGYLADRRKKKRLDVNGIPEDPAFVRLQLFRRTVRDDPTRIGKLVQFFKLTYMLRESSQQELAKAIAVLPNLKYVDLPEGMFADESTYATLRLEVQARCPDLRKMTYKAGSERSLELLASGQIWTAIEVLELNQLDIASNSIRAVLGVMHNLKALKVSDVPSFSDETLAYLEGYPSVPPLEELVLKNTPRITAAGLVSYLAWEETQNALKVLTVHNTGVSVPNLQEILTMATSLETLALQATVSETFPTSGGVQPLSSPGLRTLRYEISAPASTGAWAGVASGYYSYLASSIRSGHLPQLGRLYVEDDSFPDQLQGGSPASDLIPPSASFANGRVRSFSNGSSPRPPPPRGPPSISISHAPDDFSPAGDGGLLPVFAPTLRRPISNVPPTNRFSSNNPFSSSPSFPNSVSSPSSSAAPQMLEIFIKSEAFGKWNFARVNTFQPPPLPLPPGVPAAGARGRLPGPISTYGLGGDVRGLGWDRGEARRSVLVGNGAAGFMELDGGREEVRRYDRAEPVGGFGEEWRPGSSAGEKMSRDLWR